MDGRKPHGESLIILYLKIMQEFVFTIKKKYFTMFYIIKYREIELYKNNIIFKYCQENV